MNGENGRCTECGITLSPGVSVCPGCGAHGEELPFAPTVDSSRPGTTSVETLPSEIAQVIGRRLGEYEVTGFIGKGGMGNVFEGVHPVIGKQVAFKVLNAAFCDNPEVMERFLAEAKAVNAIGHSNIIDIFAFGVDDDGSQYFVMELLKGESLAARLKRVRGLPYREAREILVQLFSALEASHEKGIIHRDLKPDNIFLEKKSFNPLFVKVLDFGIAKFTEGDFRNGQTKTGMPIGTPYYMSPEQCSGAEVDCRTDIYALGVMLYEMFTGKRPFEGDSFMAVLTAHVTKTPVAPSTYCNMDRRLEQLILRCLAKEKEDRPQSIAQLGEELIPLLGKVARLEERPTMVEEALTLPSSLRSGPPTNPAGRKRRRRWVIPVATVTGVIALAALLVLPALQHRETSTRAGSAAAPKARPMTAPMKRGLGVPGGPRETPMSPRPEGVTLQLTGLDQIAHPRIAVDGKAHRGTLVHLAQSEARKVTITIDATGFQRWERSLYPAFSQSLHVLLTPLRAPPVEVMKPEAMRPGVMKPAPSMARPSADMVMKPSILDIL